MAYGFVIDLEKCVGCHGCSVACKGANGTPPGVTRSRVERGTEGAYPHAVRTIRPVLCMMCENPPCVAVCPQEATTVREEDGIVVIDKEKCIGCKYCMMACPYGVRSWNAAESVVEKCTLCAHLSKNGELPMCVRTCSAGARFYGDIDDPSSDASKALAAADPASIHTLQDVGNHPATHYILSPKRAAWKEGE